MRIIGRLAERGGGGADGAGLWVLLAKGNIERTRPDIVPHIVQVSGFSYPGGHSIAAASMHLTIVIPVTRHFPALRDRLVLLLLALAVILLVGRDAGDKEAGLAWAGEFAALREELAALREEIRALSRRPPDR